VTVLAALALQLRRGDGRRRHALESTIPVEPPARVLLVDPPFALPERLVLTRLHPVLVQLDVVLATVAACISHHITRVSAWEMRTALAPPLPRRRECVARSEVQCAPQSAALRAVVTVTGGKHHPGPRRSDAGKRDDAEFEAHSERES